MKCAFFFLLTIILFSCDSGKPAGTLEVFEYYPDGTIKSIANYKTGNDRRRQPGKFEILETATYQEVQQLMDSLRIPFDPANEQKGCVGSFDEAGFQRISMELVRLNKLNLITDVQLYWAQPENMEPGMMYDLYAVKFPGKNDPRVTNKEIKSVELVEQDGRQVLDLALTAEGAASFEKMTANNIDRNLAMVFGDVVYFAPRVMSVISGGKVQVQGNMSKQKYMELKNSLSARILNGEFREYHPNGELKAIRNFENGEEKGSWKEYDENGKLVKTHSR